MFHVHFRRIYVLLLSDVKVIIFMNLGCIFLCILFFFFFYLLLLSTVKSSLFKFLNLLWFIFWCYVIGYMHYQLSLNSWWIGPFIMKCPLSVIILLVLKSSLSDIIFFFWLVLKWYNFFYPFTFNFSIFFHLRWIHYKRFIFYPF